MEKGYHKGQALTMLELGLSLYPVPFYWGYSAPLASLAPPLVRSKGG